MKKDITNNSALKTEETKTEQVTKPAETSTAPKTEELNLDVKMEKAKQSKELEDRIRYGNFNQLK